MTRKSENQLTDALDELDSLLAKEGLFLQIVICGAFAIQLHGYTRALHTLDVDTIKKIDSDQIFNLIEHVGRKFGLGSRWLNDQASTVKIPDGTFERATALDKWKSIKASLIDRSDLIKMKASAFSIRREQTNKDWEDLVLMAPTQKEIASAIKFLKKTNSPPKGAGRRSIKNFEETIYDLNKLIQ